MKYRLVKVSWLDACGINEWENTEDMIKRCTREHEDPVVSVGFVIHEDRKKVIIAQTITGGVPDVDERVNNVECIPRGMITDVTVLELGNADPAQ